MEAHGDHDLDRLDGDAFDGGRGDLRTVFDVDAAEEVLSIDHDFELEKSKPNMTLGIPLDGVHGA